MSIARHLARIAALALSLAPATSPQAQKLSFTLSDTAHRDAGGKALSAPEGVACGADGSVVVADTANGRLVRYKLAKGVLQGGQAIGGPRLRHPVRVHITSQGDTLVLDRRAGAIVRIDRKGKTTGALTLSGVDGAKEAIVGSFALDDDDRLYILDLRGRRVLVASSSGAVDRALALPDDAGVVTDLAVDNNGAIYALDASRRRLYKATRREAALVAVGSPLPDDLTFASHLAMTPSRAMLVVTDRNGHGLLLLGLDGASVGRRLAMGTRAGYVYYPSQTCVTKQGSLVVTDRGNNRVQVFGTKR